MKKYAVYALALLLSILLSCCGTGRTATQLVQHTTRDTLYLSTLQYDSIYILKDKLIDRATDTVFVKDVSVEYRYRLLRDTVRVVQQDSIPYEVTVVKTKEIKRPLTFYDKLCRCSFFLLLGWILLSSLSRHNSHNNHS